MLIALGLRCHPADEDASLLRRAFDARAYRMFDARLSAAPRWQPVRAAAPLEPALRASATRILTTSSSRHSRAIAHLANGAAERAVDDLVAIAPVSRNTAVWNDLAVAFLRLAEETGDRGFLLEALAATDRALARAPKYEPALFNRALILERIGLHTFARKAWVAYLHAEVDLRWSEEALARLAAIPVSTADARWRRTFRALQSTSAAERGTALAAAVATDPQHARRSGENVVLGEWADAMIGGSGVPRPSHGSRSESVMPATGEQRAVSQLDFARELGEAVLRTTGDAMLRDAVRNIDSATTAHGKRRIAEAIAMYRDGRIAHSRNRPGDAERQLRRSAELLSACGSPLALMARYYVASTLNAQWRVDAGARVLDRLSRDLQLHPEYRALAAQLGWERGSAYLRSGAMSDALDAFTSSRDAFAQLGESDFAAAMDAAAASVLDVAGDAKSAWHVRVRALDQLSRSGNTARILVVLEEAVQPAIARHQWERAEALKSLTCALAEQVGNAAVAAYGWSSRAVLASERGELAMVQQSLAEARTWTARLDDERMRARAGADLAFAEGAALQQSAPSAALAKFDEAIMQFRSTGSRTELPAIYLARARLQKRLSRLAEARKDVDAGLGIVREERRALRDVSKRTTLIENTNALFDEAIELALRAGERERAFDLSDEQRARSLTDRFLLGAAANTNEAASLSANAIRNELAADAAIVAFASLSDRLLTFVVRRDSFHVTSAAVPRSRVAAVTASLRAAANRGDARARDACIEAHELLLAGILPQLHGVRQLAIVSDERVGDAPFGALFDRRSGQFLAERMNLTIAPSATLLVEASRRWKRIGGWSLLAVGGNAFDRRRFPQAEPLRHVSREIEAVARLYRTARVLLAEDASAPTISRMIPSHAIVHFAAHAVTVAAGAGTAEPALLVAPAGGRGEFRASDIAGATLSETRLVVLAACRSAVGAAGSRGNDSLARSFVAAGVPSVVATMSDLADRDSEALMSTFHSHIASGTGPSTALGETVRGTIRDARGTIRFPLSWANILNIGGSGEFIGNEKRGRKS